MSVKHPSHFSDNTVGATPDKLSLDSCEETLRLKKKLEAADQSRLNGEKTYSLEESRKQIAKIWG